MLEGLLFYSPLLLILCPFFVWLRCRSCVWALLVAVGLSLLALIPYNELSFIQRLTGIVSQLSITSVVALVLWPILRFKNARINSPDSLFFSVAVIALALCLYPMALGLGHYDPYALGYNPVLLLSVLGVLGGLAALKGFKLCAFTVCAILAAYWLRVLQSNNLWDYMLDPVIAVYALIYVGRYWLRQRPLLFKRSAAPIATPNEESEQVAWDDEPASANS